MDTIMTAADEQNQNSKIIQVDFVVCYGEYDNDVCWTY
jgi:hypothetical protein